MPCYVDDIMKYPDEMIASGARHNGTHWCHLFTDPGNEEELHKLASKIGLRRAWFQNKPGFPHYDIVPGKRIWAIRCGAIPTNLRVWIAERKTNAS